MFLASVFLNIAVRRKASLFLQMLLFLFRDGLLPLELSAFIQHIAYVTRNVGTVTLVMGLGDLPLAIGVDFVVALGGCRVGVG